MAPLGLFNLKQAGSIPVRSTPQSIRTGLGLQAQRARAKRKCAPSRIGTAGRFGETVRRYRLSEDAGPALGDVLLFLDHVEGHGAVQVSHVELGDRRLGAAGLLLDHGGVDGERG